MSYQAYFDYLGELMDEIWEAWPRGSTDLRAIIFKLTASPYHFWLENQAALRQFSPEEERITRDIHADSPPESSARKEPPAADKAAISGPDLSMRKARADEVSLSAEDSSNLTNKAQEIRGKARTAIREYKTTGVAQWSPKALSALWALKDDWAKGVPSLYKALDDIDDKELCLWNEKHGVFM